jgi:hypothetical protein
MKALPLLFSFGVNMYMIISRFRNDNINVVRNFITVGKRTF